MALQPRRLYFLIISKFSYFLIPLFITCIYPFFSSFTCTILLLPFPLFPFLHHFIIVSFPCKFSFSSNFHYSFPSLSLVPLFLVFFLLEHRYENVVTGVVNWNLVRISFGLLPVLSHIFLSPFTVSPHDHLVRTLK